MYGSDLLPTYILCMDVLKLDLNHCGVHSNEGVRQRHAHSFHLNVALKQLLEWGY